MTIEEKKRLLYKYCYAQRTCQKCKLEGMKKRKTINGCDIATMTEEETEKAYDVAFGGAEKVEPETETTCCIKDSGERREFETGAVRDIQEGKGRCDLLPLDVIAEFYSDIVTSAVLLKIEQFKKTGNLAELEIALLWFFGEDSSRKNETCFLELSKHFEEGAKKYGENNWQKGIPAHCYIDSAVRHYLKLLRGDIDEPHDRAFVWNLICCIWTCKNKPELNDFSQKTNGFEKKITESDCE